MTTIELQKWARNLSVEDYVDVVMFYLRLCKVCEDLKKQEGVL